MAEPVRPEELIAALRESAEDVRYGWGVPVEQNARAALLIAVADALEAAGDGLFVIDATGRVLGTLEAISWQPSPLYRLRPSLTEEPQQ